MLFRDRCVVPAEWVNVWIPGAAQLKFSSSVHVSSTTAREFADLMSDGNGPSEVRRRLEERYLRLARARRLRPIAAIVARFAEIEGGALGTMVSVQLFTTVIPLMIKGFSYMTGFADNASPGTVFIRELGLVHPTSDRVRSAFGESAGLRSSWTFLGVAGFLVWDIPMAITIAGIFAKAWHREPFGFTGKLWPGGGVVRALPDDDRSARPHRLRRRPPRRDAAAAVRGVAGARLDLLVESQTETSAVM